MPSAHSSLSALLLWLSVVAAAEAQNRTEEVQILLAFKNNAYSSGYSYYGKPGAGYIGTWKETDENPCAWVGVTCTANSTVEELNLSGWGQGLGDLSFSILSGLTSLRHFDFSNNDIDAVFSTIPGDIDKLTGLTYLDLSGNNFSGQIPSEISSCQSLRYIYLENTSLEGEIPSLRGLTELQVLRLADNYLTGPFPIELEDINSLISIDLSNNSLSGTIPSLSGLTNLVELSLDNNKFTKFEEPLFPNARSLKYLSISGNQLEGKIPDSITNLNLSILHLSHNQLSGEIPSGLSKQLNQSLISLDLSQNNLVGSIPPELLQASPFPSLQILQESQNITLYINISHNSLTGSIPILLAETHGGYPGCSFQLDLSFNSLSGPVPIIANNSLSLSLSLQNNNLSGDIVDVLVNSPYPFIYRAPSDSYSLDQFYRAELQLQNNLFTGDLSRLTSNCVNSSLALLDLSSNSLQWNRTDTTPDPLRVALETCPIAVFRVGGNNFSGISLPNELYFSSDYSLITQLDLSNTHLTGMISDAVFNSTWFPNLQILNLSNNDIIGSIPESIVKLPNLVAINVSNNNMFGPLPFISSSSILYNPSLFLGNDGLCGAPLPPCTTESRRIRVTWWLLMSAVGGFVIIVVGSCLVATWRWKVYCKMHEQDADLIKTLLEGELATLISLRELKSATNNFSKSAQIGEGAFGIVYKGQLNDGTIVAIKRSKREGFEKEKNQFLNEVKILSQVNHRNLVKLLGCCMENKVAVLVFEFISNSTLQEHLRGEVGQTCLSWPQRVKIATQIADALNYLHSAATIPIYHRDVKSANILLDGDLNAKVTDFGISKLVPVEATHVSTIAIQGTLGYIDPEYYTLFKLTDRSDVYSFGVILLELISAKPVIDFHRVGEETSLVFLASPQIKSGDLQRLIDPSLMETYNDPSGFGRESILKMGRLAMTCLNMLSKARPSMNEVWKELQNLMIEVDQTSKHSGHHLDFIYKDDNEGLQHDNIGLSPDSLCCSRSNFEIEVDTKSIEMSLPSP